MRATKPDTPLQKSEAVDAFLVTLTHPLAKEAGQLRRIILDADARVREGVKWNAPSFYFRDWFATFHLRSNQEIALILHRGAKTKAPLKTHFVRNDGGLVTWITNDRGKIAFRSAAEIQKNSEALQELIRNWLAAMDADA